MSVLEESRRLLSEASEAAKEAKKEKDSAGPKPKEGRRRGRSGRTTIPARVEPGVVHYEIANRLLEMFAQRMSANFKQPINVGQGVEVVPQTIDGEADEGTEPAELLARIVAHVFYRVPGLRKIEKRLEGTEKKAGIGSDFVALLMQLYRRNKHLLPLVMEAVQEEARRNKAKTKGGTPTVVVPPPDSPS